MARDTINSDFDELTIGLLERIDRSGQRVVEVMSAFGLNEADAAAVVAADVALSLVPEEDRLQNLVDWHALVRTDCSRTYDAVRQMLPFAERSQRNQEPDLRRLNIARRGIHMVMVAEQKRFEAASEQRLRQRRFSPRYVDLSDGGVRSSSGKEQQL